MVGVQGVDGVGGGEGPGGGWGRGWWGSRGWVGIWWQGSRGGWVGKIGDWNILIWHIESLPVCYIIDLEGG